MDLSVRGGVVSSRDGKPEMGVREITNEECFQHTAEREISREARAENEGR